MLLATLQRWISAPVSTQKYFTDDDVDQISLEDDSGRVRLVGDMLKTTSLVTGCIIAVMGTENTDGELEVIDIKFPDLPPQPERWSLSKRPPPQGADNAAENGSRSSIKDEDQQMTDDSASNSSKIALVSGLSFSGVDTSHSLELDLLLEYLLGEALAPLEQRQVSNISRLIIAGNSISTVDAKLEEEAADKKGSKKYGYDASTYNPLPSQLLDEFLAQILPSIPVTLMPGASDPANSSYPQQPIHNAMFPSARMFAGEPTQIPAAAKTKTAAQSPAWFDTVTNPWCAEIDGWRVLGTGGQNVDDVFKYVESDDRLGMMEAMCRWRCCAPTAPDTLCKIAPSLCLTEPWPFTKTKALKNAISPTLRANEVCL